MTEPIVYGTNAAEEVTAPPASSFSGSLAMAHSTGGTRNPEIKRILGLSVPCRVVLAQQEMSIRSILGITVGTIIEFNTSFDADLTLYVANRPIARGQAVKVGENFGLRIDHIDSLEHRIDALGGH